MKIHRAILIFVLAFLSISLILSGCEPKPEPKEKTPTIKQPPKGPVSIDVSETEFRIDPDKITVYKGKEVTFKVKNDGTVTHVFALQGMAKEVQVEPGETKELKVTFNNTGKIEYLCNIDAHDAKGMIGELTVK